MNSLSLKNIKIYEHDLPNNFLDEAGQAKTVGWDIETSGLDWRYHRIGTCQLSLPNKSAAVVKITEAVPKNLSSLLTDDSVRKIFHHAIFDLSFMSYHWKVKSQNVTCTKIASKLLGTDGRHTLQAVLKKYLDITIDKEQRLSNWMVNELTEEQIFYVAKDVIYLIPLLYILEKKLKAKNLLELAQDCFNFIPTRVQLELLGHKDIYSYQNAKNL